MPSTLRPLFAPLRWHQAAEYAAMMLFTLAVPIHWRLGVWTLVLLMVCATVKAIATRQIGNPTATKASRICLWLMVLHYFIYLFSIHYSQAPFEGLAESAIKLPMLLLPLFFLFSNLSHLSRKHLSALALLLPFVLTLRYAVMQTQALLDYMASTPFAKVIHTNFDPMHYNYLALYIVIAIIILFFEILRHWHSPRWRWWRWVLMADIFPLIEYILMVCSRSGLLTLLFAAAVGLTYLCMRKKPKPAVLAGIALALFLGLNYLTMPKLFSRSIDTIAKMEQGQEGDVRQDIWSCAIDLIEGHEIIGYGNEGYWVELYNQYLAHDLHNCYVEKKLRIHNQYLETLVATGLVGLAVLVAMVALPTILSLTRRHWNPLMALFSLSYALWIFFEEAYARQMGMLSICWWYGLFLTLWAHCAPMPDIFPWRQRRAPTP